MSGRHLVSTEPTATACRCGATVLEALAEGLHARVDPAPLNPAGEITAICAGRATYTWRRYELIHRDLDRIGDPRMASRVVAAHRCGTYPPAQHRANEPATTVTAETEGIPF